MSSYISDLTPEELKRNFDIYDKDGSGSIQITEMKALFARNGAELSQGAQQYLWTKYDKNSDGMIDYYEFVEYLTGKSFERPVQATQEKHLTSGATGSAQFQDEFHNEYLDGYKEGYLKGLLKFKELKASGQLPTLHKSQTITVQQQQPNERAVSNTATQPQDEGQLQQDLGSQIHYAETQAQPQDIW